MQTTYCLTVAALLLSIIAASSFIAHGSLDDDKIFSPAIPDEIKVPSGNKLHIVLYAVGQVNYIFNGSAWALQNVTADLYVIPGGKVIGKHFFLPKPDAKGGQPSWETFHPKSLVTMKSLAEVTVDPKSITWTLFQATSRSGSRASLGAVTYLQRVDAKAGLPPSSSVGVQKGDTNGSPYSIIYAYYVKEN